MTRAGDRRLSRRGLLVAGGGAVTLGAAGAAYRYRTDDGPDGPVPDVTGVAVKIGRAHV